MIATRHQAQPIASLIPPLQPNPQHQVPGRCQDASVTGGRSLPPLSLTISPAVSHWKRSARLASDQVIHIDLELAVDQDISGIAAQALESISDPDSPSFGQHWTPNRIAQFFAPLRESIRQVGRWLNSSGVPRSAMRLSRDGTFLSFSVSVRQAEQLLGAGFHLYRHRYYNADGVGAVLVAVTVQDPPTPKGGIGARQTCDVDCLQYIAPQCLRQLAWLAEDLDMFFGDFAPDLVGQRPNLMSIAGGTRQTECQLTNFNHEPNLDYEYTMAMASRSP
ncbi:Pro-kumamolisin, activation domain-containing protein [Neurospora crassa]|nr:Pro-kumamolisin, activation domain-containing protein [Neurospora crassa]